MDGKQEFHDYNNFEKDQNMEIKRIVQVRLNIHSSKVSINRNFYIHFHFLDLIQFYIHFDCLDDDRLQVQDFIPFKSFKFHS